MTLTWKGPWRGLLLVSFQFFSTLCFFGIKLLSLPTSHSPLDSLGASSILSLCFALISSSLFLSTYLLRKIKDEIPLVTITTLKKLTIEKRQTCWSTKILLNFSEIVFFILMTLMLHSAVILGGKIKCLSLLRCKFYSRVP